MQSGTVENGMKMEISEFGPVTVVKPIDQRMDAHSVVGFKATMHEIADSGTDHVVLDMSRVEFMDSSGLGALVAVLKHMSPDKKFEIAGLTAAVEKVFRLTRMDYVFKVHASINDVIAPQKKAG